MRTGRRRLTASQKSAMIAEMERRTPCQAALYDGDKETVMTPLEIILAATAIGMSGGGIAYTLYVVRRAPRLERPTEAQVRRMINTAPRCKFDNALAR